MGRWSGRVATDAVTVVGYLGLAALAAQFVVPENIATWYPPAGLAFAAATIRGWRALPSLAVAETLVGVLLFGAVDDLGWLIVPSVLTYAAVYAAAGRVMAGLGATAPTVAWRRPLRIIVLGIGAPTAAAAVRVVFQVVAGATSMPDAPMALIVSALGEASGAASVAVTLVTMVVRARRGGRWWAIPGVPMPTAVLAVLAPGGLLALLAAGVDGVVPYTATLLLPFLALCVLGGVPAAGLAAFPTGLTMTIAAHRAAPTDLVALTDLQLLLLLVIATGVFVAMVVEERRELQLRLEQRERNLRHAQVQAGTGSFTWDVLSNEIESSEGLFHLLGVEPTQMSPERYTAFVLPEDRGAVMQRISAAIDENRPYESTHHIVRADGEVRSIRAVVSPREFDGRVVELIGTLTDVTDEEAARRRLEDAVVREQTAAAAERSARRAASEAAAAIEQAERIKEALLIAVSHEVRTPLTIVRGVVETLQHPRVAPGFEPHGEMIRQLDRQTRRLERVLTDLLDVDRIGRGVVEPKRRPTHVPTLVDAVVDTVDLGGDKLRVHIADGVDEFPLDAAISARILEHLLLNAHRHAPGSPIEVDVRAVDGQLELRVEDRGPGIPEIERGRALDAFTTMHRHHPQPTPGVGLFIVSRFAELHGGRVTIEDRDGGGTTVTVVLPRNNAMVESP